MSLNNPEFKFKIGDEVFHNNPWYVGHVQCTYVDLYDGRIFCVVKSRSGTTFVTEQHKLKKSKVIMLAVPRGVDAVKE